jgi:hypothetical protein
MAADDLQSSPHWRTYTTIALAAAGVASEVATHGPFRGIRCHTAGTLVIKPAKGGSTTDATAFLAGERDDIMGTAITEAGSSGCVPIKVYW